MERLALSLTMREALSTSLLRSLDEEMRKPNLICGVLFLLEIFTTNLKKEREYKIDKQINEIHGGRSITTTCIVFSKKKKKST